MAVCDLCGIADADLMSHEHADCRRRRDLAWTKIPGYFERALAVDIDPQRFRNLIVDLARGGYIGDYDLRVLATIGLSRMTDVVLARGALGIAEKARIASFAAAFGVSDQTPRSTARQLPGNAGIALPPRHSNTAPIVISLVTLAVLLVGAGYLWFGWINPPPDRASLARVLAGRQECIRLAADMTRLGMVGRVEREGGDVVLYVDGRTWQAQDTMKRLTQTLTFWCALMPYDGYLTVTVRDGIEGNNLFRVRNGHVVPWF